MSIIHSQAMINSTEGVAINLGNYSISAENITETSAAAGVKFSKDGEVFVGSSTASTNVSYGAPVNRDPDEWADPQSSDIGAGYEIRFSPTSGSLSQGTSGVWLSLSVDRVFEVNRTGLGSKTVTGFFEIRNTIGVVLATSPNSTLTATVISEPGGGA